MTRKLYESPGVTTDSVVMRTGTIRNRCPCELLRRDLDTYNRTICPQLQTRRSPSYANLKNYNVKYKKRTMQSICTWDFALRFLSSGFLKCAEFSRRSPSALWLVVKSYKMIRWVIPDRSQTVANCNRERRDNCRASSRNDNFHRVVTQRDW